MLFEQYPPDNVEYQQHPEYGDNDLPRVVKQLEIKLAFRAQTVDSDPDGLFPVMPEIIDEGRHIPRLLGRIHKEGAIVLDLNNIVVKIRIDALPELILERKIGLFVYRLPINTDRKPITGTVVLEPGHIYHVRSVFDTIDHPARTTVIFKLDGNAVDLHERGRKVNGGFKVEETLKIEFGVDSVVSYLGFQGVDDERVVGRYRLAVDRMLYGLRIAAWEQRFQYLHVCTVLIYRGFSDESRHGHGYEVGIRYLLTVAVEFDLQLDSGLDHDDYIVGVYRFR